MTRGAKQEVKCARCKQPFLARVADIKRGWGKFCKAIKQEQRTGQYAALQDGSQRVDDFDPSWNAHKYD